MGTGPARPVQTHPLTLSRRLPTMGPMSAGASFPPLSRDRALRHFGKLLATDAPAVAEGARELIRREPHDAEAWRLLGRALRKLGADAEAGWAELRAIDASTHDPELLQAAHALRTDDLPQAEMLLRARLKAKPFDVAAIRMMGELAARIGRFADSELLLRRTLELAPGFTAARTNLATVLHRQHRSSEALAELDALLAEDPDNAQARNLKAAALGRTGSYEEAAQLYEEVLARFPDQPKIWMSYGHILKTVGRREDSIGAYRRALGQNPRLGEVWWSLANLKTYSFDGADLDIMRSALGRNDLSEEDRLHLHFALGKALEDAGRPEESFSHYAEGNRLRRAQIRYEAADISDHVRRSRALFTPAFFEARRHWGCPAPDPIFVLGMPRAGSTLVEQILASHPAIEGTMELPDIPALVKRLGGRQSRAEPGAYPECLAELDSRALAELGQEYLDRTRIQRKTDKPFFIDKMPNNWAHVGLIALILPNARIIDVRRHPLACCFSNFKQHFARGQGFTYALSDLGYYYRDYVALLHRFDQVLPGRIHRVIHERLVEDPEAEIRAMLAYLDVPFDEACLRFHENARPVRTASSEQVRRPINREGIDRWRDFEPWLGPLKEALGPVLASYPDAPADGGYGADG